MNIVKQYKKWSNYIDPITLIQSVKKYYCLNNENCCLIVIDNKEFHIMGNLLINKIMKYIIKKLRSIMFDYNYFYTRNIPIYIFLLQNDILFNFLLNETNYNFDLLLNKIEIINAERQDNLFETINDNILSFVYNKYSYIPLDELNKKIELLKNNQFKNKFINISLNKNIKLKKYCQINNINKFIQYNYIFYNKYYLDNDYYLKLLFYYYDLLNNNKFEDIKLFNYLDVFLFTIALLNIKCNDKLNNYIIKFCNKLMIPNNNYSIPLHFTYYLLNYYCDKNNLKIKYNNFNIININDINEKNNIYELYNLFISNITRSIKCIRYFKEYNDEINYIANYQIFFDYIKFNNKDLCNINKNFNKYFKDEYYYVSNNLLYFKGSFKGILKSYIKNKKLGQFIINKYQFNILNKLFNNINKIKYPNELLNLFDLCFSTYKNTNYDYTYVGLKLFLQKKYNININNDYLTNHITIFSKQTDNILKSLEIFITSNLIKFNGNSYNIDNLKDILKTQDCIFNISLYKINNNEHMGHSAKLYFDHKYKEIYFIIPEGNNINIYDFIYDNLNVAFKELNFTFIKDKYKFDGFQEIYNVGYNYEEIIGYCVSISLFLCHMYYLLKDELHKYYNSNEIHFILHKLLYDKITYLTHLSGTNKNMYMKFFNNYNSLLGNYNINNNNVVSFYTAVNNDLFDFNNFNENYKNICKKLNN